MICIEVLAAKRATGLGDTHISPQCELANETTADKSLGIAVPERLLALADEVIE
jgi:hypothetical protein